MEGKQTNTTQSTKVHQTLMEFEVASKWNFFWFNLENVRHQTFNCTNSNLWSIKISRFCPVICSPTHSRSNDSCTSRVHLHPSHSDITQNPVLNQTQKIKLAAAFYWSSDSLFRRALSCKIWLCERLFTTSLKFLHTRRRRFMNEVHLARSHTWSSGFGWVERGVSFETFLRTSGDKS